MKHRGPFLIVLSIVLAAYVTWLRGYFGILLFAGDYADGEVITYSAGSGLGGDWTMRYRFISVDHIPHEGRATFASKVRPPDDVQQVRVKYLPISPSISGVVGYISVTGIVAYFFFAWTLWRGLRFTRYDRSKAPKPTQAPEPPPAIGRGPS